ncbi:polyketide synthase [Grosmannia clavigera kw1407]|uniref:Polyketide synthase n=1 Tax=Grosmannia clavigera (strain kw1407 / UAMH 11150) TaxID=655863 RepID=F0XAR9_GROCL|nr:polyketide synthase [Grosmannia clavigera kw1407]EFX05857.1 polyketide synthase [Grosmannia clavigera kw1407]
MVSITKAHLPSILVFGPQTELPLEKSLQDCRQELVENPRLSALRAAVGQLPDNTVSHYGLAVTVLVQITQYCRYLEIIGKDAHRRVLDSVQSGGVQGFCVGFLSTVAVASSDDESNLGTLAAVALRLAVCIGAYVDADGARNADDYMSVAVRWQDENDEDKEKVAGIVQSIPGAYISSLNDYSNLTVTIRASSLGVLEEEATRKNLRIKDVHVHGRFHTVDHSSAVDKILAFSQLSDGLSFPEPSRLQDPIRNTADGGILPDGSPLTRISLESAMVNVADWYATMKLAIQQLPKSERTVAVAGFGSGIPASLTRDTHLQVLSLAKLDTQKPKLNGFQGTEPYDPQSSYPPHSIAIVGMAGRFPGADSVDELWDLLMQGKTMVQPAPVERLGLPQTGDHANTKWWGNFLDNPETFDHKFFKKSSREAVAWDPQQRLLLEVIYEALESSGYFGASASPEPVDYGRYIGAVMNNYYDNLSCHAGTAYATVGTSRCYLSGCMSHYFGWTGPALTIDTACSSSLVAIHTACRAIWSGECSRAVAGGTNVISSPFDYQNLSAAGFLSPSGQCKPFDADADSYCRGEGVAVVVLKPLADAVENGDKILGVIVGSAANQNHNVGPITAPHSTSQANLYKKVLSLGRVRPEDVSYVEAHGTGTGVGDPIEVASIREAFGVDRQSVLHFGSIKGNIGHTQATAGVAGLIKVLLMMRHRTIPSQASRKSLNPKITAFDPTTMAIPRQTIPWQASTFLALVNSYGAAGSNSAVLIREGPSATSTENSPQLSRYPLFISAGSPNGLAAYCKKFLD